MVVILLIAACIAGYLLGSANSSLIVGKFYGVDIRKHGSGNAGTTNTLRTIGKKAAFFVLLGDLLKGVLAYLAGCLITGDGLYSIHSLGGMIAGTAAILGHVWPVYFGFKGGKGVMTTLAVALMIDWSTALILLAIFAIIVLITRYVSLGSIIAAVLFPVSSLILGKSLETVIFSALIAVLLVFMHRTNIKRLLNGTESKLGAKKQEA